MKLFLDDIRNPKDIYKDNNNWDWIIVRTYEEFVNYIKENGIPDFISFDHDLADEHYIEYFKSEEEKREFDYNKIKEKTGYDCAKWLIENGYEIKKYAVHSFNPVGKENILNYLKNQIK